MMLRAALLVGVLAVAAQAAPPSPVVATLLDVLGTERAAELGPGPGLQETAQAVPPELRPAARAALSRLEKSGKSVLLTELSRAYSLLGDEQAALAAADALRRARPGPESEVQHALALARSGDDAAAYAAALALDEKYPGRPDVASLLAATKGRGRSTASTSASLPGKAAPAAPRDVSPQALAAMEQAVSARRTGDVDAAWRHALEAMRADPASPIIQELYRAAEADRRRHARPRGPDMALAADLPREETPAPAGGLPLWPALPAAGLGAAAFAVARRGRPFASDHDYEANDYHAGETERFVAGAVIAGMAGGAIYLGGAWLIGAAPAVIRAASGPGQQALRIARSEAGAILPKGNLPNAHAATIDVRKLTEYALNPQHPVGMHKAKVFSSVLGYTPTNHQGLLDQIRAGILRAPAIPGIANEHGKRFTVDVLVNGPAGSAVVRTAWIYAPGSDAPTLTTLYIR